MLVNIMEKIVDTKIEKYMNDPEKYCMCELCVNDVKCYALNHLPCKYVNSDKGELFAKVDQLMLKQNSVDVDFAVINAIEVVCKSPRCKNKDEAGDVVDSVEKQ